MPPDILRYYFAARPFRATTDTYEYSFASFPTCADIGQIGRRYQPVFSNLPPTRMPPHDATPLINDDIPRCQIILMTRFRCSRMKMATFCFFATLPSKIERAAFVIYLPFSCSSGSFRYAHRHADASTSPLQLLNGPAMPMMTIIAR